MLKGTSKETKISVLPRMADPRKFSQQGIHLEGFVAVADLPRLASALASDRAAVTAKLEFGIGDEGRKVLSGHVNAQVEVVCQRCLDNLPLVIEADLNLAVVWDEDQAVNLPKYLDPWIHGEGPADLYGVIEEELLLELPLVAYHESECVEPERFHSGDVVEHTDTPNNPFQMLEQLKSSPK